jgi:hypothetical protein
MIISGSEAACSAITWNFCPVEALAGLQAHLAILNPQLNAIAVEFDFVQPAGPGRRASNRLAQLRRDEIRQRR